MKKCPYCAEEIQDEAIKCKHCDEFLDNRTSPTSNLGNLIFSYGTRSKIVIHANGCRVSSKGLNQVLTWGEIEKAVITHPYKMTVNTVTGRKDYNVCLYLKTGARVSVDFTQIGVLWGLEFIYHNSQIKKLIQSLARFIPVQA